MVKEDVIVNVVHFPLFLFWIISVSYLMLLQVHRANAGVVTKQSKNKLPAKKPTYFYTICMIMDTVKSKNLPDICGECLNVCVSVCFCACVCVCMCVLWLLNHWIKWFPYCTLCVYLIKIDKRSNCCCGPWAWQNLATITVIDLCCWILAHLQVFVAVAGGDGLHCLLWLGSLWQVPAVGWTGVGVHPQ